MSAYATSVEIPHFSGINQTGDGYNMGMMYAREMENVDISGGSFKPMRDGRLLEQKLDAPIGTLAYLHRRFGADTGTLLVAISDGCLYTKTLDGDDEWELRYPGEGGTPLAVSDCDWVTYEVNERDNEPLEEAVDVLLFTNATDGMFCLYGDTLEVESITTPYDFGVLARYNERIWGAGVPDNPDLLVYSAPYKPFDWDPDTSIPENGGGEIRQPTWDGDSFQSLRQYGSDLLAIKRNSIWRIYGTNPGEFVMQRQYGGGTIVENTVAINNDYAYMLGEYGILRYDGTGAYPFLQEQVEDLMRKSVTKALDPAKYTEYDSFKAYYPGARCVKDGIYYWCNTTNEGDAEVSSVTSVMDDGREVTIDDADLFLAELGKTATKTYVITLTYTGSGWQYGDDVYDLEDIGIIGPTGTTSPGQRMQVTVKMTYPWNATLWRVVNENPRANACAGMWNQTYCLALPINGSDTCNAILQYDTQNRTFSLRTGVSVDSFLQVNERLFFTSADYPGVVYEMDDLQGTTKFLKWISGYQDLGVKSSIKSAFILYMMVDSEVPIELRLGIRTEKKLKRKQVITKPGKLTRVQMNTHGRVFRLEIESYTAAPFTIAGGIKIDLELDPD